MIITQKGPSAAVSWALWSQPSFLYMLPESYPCRSPELSLRGRWIEWWSTGHTSVWSSDNEEGWRNNLSAIIPDSGDTSATHTHTVQKRACVQMTDAGRNATHTHRSPYSAGLHYHYNVKQGSLQPKWPIIQHQLYRASFTRWDLLP